MTTPSYDAGEALILTQIQAVDGFNSKNTARGKWQILNHGESRQYCILRRGGFERKQLAFGGTYETNWMTIAEIWVLWKDYGETLEKIEEVVDNVTVRFDQYRKAADTTGKIRDVFVRGANDPQDVVVGKRRFYKQELRIEWAEETTVTLQE